LNTTDQSIHLSDHLHVYNDGKVALGFDNQPWAAATLNIKTAFSVSQFDFVHEVEFSRIGSAIRMLHNGSILIGLPSLTFVQSHDLVVSGNVQIRQTSSSLIADAAVQLQYGRSSGTLIDVPTAHRWSVSSTSGDLVISNFRQAGFRFEFPNSTIPWTAMHISGNGSIGVGGIAQRISNMETINVYGPVGIHPSAEFMDSVYFDKRNVQALMVNAFPGENGYRFIADSVTSSVIIEKTNLLYGTGNVYFYNSNTELVTVFPTNRVGILMAGATANAELDVNGNTGFRDDVDVDGTVDFNRLSPLNQDCLVLFSGSNQPYKIRRVLNTDINPAGSNQFDATVFLQQNRATVFTQSTLGPQRPDLVITSTGLIGMNTLFPSSALEVNGNVFVQGQIHCESTIVVFEKLAVHEYWNHRSGAFSINDVLGQFRFQTNALPLDIYSSTLVLWPSSSVSVGLPVSSTPSAQLHVAGAGYVNGNAVLMDNGIQYVWAGSDTRTFISSNYLIIQQDFSASRWRTKVRSTTGDLTFGSLASPALTIRRVGATSYVGVNQRTPTSPFHVTGTSYLGGNLVGWNRVHASNLVASSLAHSIQLASESTLTMRAAFVSGWWSSYAWNNYVNFNVAYQSVSGHVLTFAFGTAFYNRPNCIAAMVGSNGQWDVNVEASTTVVYVKLLIRASPWGYYSWTSYSGAPYISVTCFGTVNV
jgi:hypothetical protein